MKILLNSHTFAPNIGGIESMSLVLADEFIKAGHEVKVVTQTPAGESPPNLPYPVLRHPGRSELIHAVRWSDVVFHNNISLQTAWPLLLVRRPWVIVHQTWIRAVDGSINRAEKVKRWAIRFAHQIAISQAVADDVNGCKEIIGNCYNSSLFRELPGVLRDRDVVFVGRLVSDKGVDLAIRAVAEIPDTTLTIIGGGEEEEALRNLVTELNLQDRITFTGPLSGESLVEQINRHRVMVVPSRWKEPFGIVALEGIACGCTIVGSEGGGLKDAIGPCGLTFENDNLADLTEKLATMLSDQELYNRCRQVASAHLGRFTAPVIAAAYLKVFERVIRR